MKKIVLIIISIFSILYLSANDKIKVGIQAPVFTISEQETSTSALKNNKYLVLIFYRGNWCPICMKHISELNDSIQLITDKYASVVIVTPEAPESIIETKEKTKVNKLNIIYDKDYKIMKAFDVDYKITKKSVPKFYSFVKKFTRNANKNNDDILPIPATFIINQENKIIYQQVDKNYKNRASVAQIIEQLK